MKETYLMIALVAILVIPFTILAIWFFREGKGQEKIIYIRNQLEKLKLESSRIEDEPLVMRKCDLPQRNEGPKQHDKRFPTIKVNSYGSDCQLAPKTKGIWC